uniref:hypothetical protein n=1 Tax=Herbidospora sakaeratensis TaxID=564415 RepID=UPI000A6C97A9|nr:hypothetical protein [Herbidospora sakaeratensis]
MNLAGDQNVKRLRAASIFLVGCVLPDGYLFPSSLESAVTLTSSGEELLAELTARFPAVADADIRAAMLGAFAIGDKLLIDHKATSFEDLRQAIDPDIRNKIIRYPWVHGDELESVYRELYGQSPKAFISHADTTRVLDHLPQGVFQIADVIVGPFGMLVGPQERHLPPVLNGPEVSCSDPGCPGVHHVEFRTGETDAGKVYSSLGVDSPLSYSLRQLLMDIRMPDQFYYRPGNDWGLPWLLMSGFTSDERRTLLSTLLMSNEDNIRVKTQTMLGRRASKKSPDELSRLTSEAESLQLLLCVNNDQLIRHLEQLIDSGHISMGVSETRYPIRGRTEDGYFRSRSEASRLGVRFRPRMELTYLRLKNFIQQLYSGHGRKELLWLLRQQPGVGDIEKLDNYLSQNTPEEAIKTLVLATRDRMDAAIAIVGAGHFVQPTDQESEDFLVQRILWKLGAPLPPPPASDARVQKFILAFQASSSEAVPRNEVTVERVRSQGVTMFVALESLLHETINYICWLLFSDHYPAKRDARFTYRAKMATKFSERLLGDYAHSHAGYSYGTDGKNSLGSLLDGFAMTAEICADPEPTIEFVRRPDDVLPHATQHTPIYIFPFLHTRLIYDLHPECREKIADTLTATKGLLVGGNVPWLRNSLSHPRPTFPDHSAVMQACTSITQTLSNLRATGLLPTVYKKRSATFDGYGRQQTVMEDGDGNELDLVGPSEIDKSGLPGLEEPQLIPFGLRFRSTGEPIRLKFVEETPFTALLDSHIPIPFPELNSTEIKSSQLD